MRPGPEVYFYLDLMMLDFLKMADWYPAGRLMTRRFPR
jgi:hypothetical protein